MKLITNNDVEKRISTLVYHLLGCGKKTELWMKERRPFWKNKSAVEMIRDDKLYAVMDYIERTLF